MKMNEKMLKYVDVKVVFAEIPSEITLAISISGCPCHCPGCHSSYLSEDIGERLDISTLDSLIEKQKDGITCVCFMGGDADPAYISQLAGHIHRHYPKIKTAWYSGVDLYEGHPSDYIDIALDRISHKVNLSVFDYIKYGSYDSKAGPLTSKTTNQVLLKIEDGHTTDITSEFWKEKI